MNKVLNFLRNLFQIFARTVKIINIVIFLAILYLTFFYSTGKVVSVSSFWIRILSCNRTTNFFCCCFELFVRTFFVTEFFCVFYYYWLLLIQSRLEKMTILMIFTVLAKIWSKFLRKFRTLTNNMNKYVKKPFFDYFQGFLKSKLKRDSTFL